MTKQPLSYTTLPLKPRFSGLLSPLFLILFVCLIAPQTINALPVDWPSSHGLTTPQIEQFLTTAKITKVKDLSVGITKPKRLTLKQSVNGTPLEMRAVFKYLSTKISHVKGKSKRHLINNSDRYEHDIAAYRLDQMLGLNMVPVSVPRKLENTFGMAQFWIENAIVYKALYASDNPTIEGCDFSEQNAIMNVFDVLIHNDDRNQGNVLFTADNCRLWMIDHSKAFRVRHAVPKNLKALKISISQQFAEKLQGLTKIELMANLSDLLHESQIDALLTRRDMLLEKWPPKPHKPSKG
jgi:hypothetical protein